MQRHTSSHAGQYAADSLTDLFGPGGGGIEGDLNVFHPDTSTSFHPSEFEIHFETPFKDKYQRNNKQSKRKNLRCFPSCHPAKHWTTGFCGQPVKIVLRNCATPAARVRCWAQFETAGNPNSKGPDQVVPEPTYQVGQVISESEIACQERCRQCPMAPFMRGNIYAGVVDFDANGFEIVNSKGRRELNMGSVTVVINSERMGWHYSWVSNKHSCDSFHVIKLYIFAMNADGRTMVCQGSHSSPKFQIFCRRRQRKPSPAASKPVVGKGHHVTETTLASSSTTIKARGRQAPVQDDIKLEIPEPPNASMPQLEPFGSNQVSSRYHRAAPLQTPFVNPFLAPPGGTAVAPAGYDMLQQQQQQQHAYSNHASGIKRKSSSSAWSVSSAGSKRTGPRTQKLQRVDSEKMSDQTLLKLMEFTCFRGNYDEENQPGQTNGTKKEGNGAVEDFASNLLGNILTGLDMFNEQGGGQSAAGGSSSSSSSDAAGEPAISVQLARYLFDEGEFTSEISGFFAKHRGVAYGDTNSLETLFLRFVSIVRSHINGFVKTKGLTVKEFERCLEKESKKADAGSFNATNVKLADGSKLHMRPMEPEKRFNSFKVAFFRRLQSESRPSVFTPDARPVPPHFDISGSWLNSGQFEEEYKRAYEDLKRFGYPVFMFSTMRNMMWRFRITISNDYFHLQGEKKLMHSGEFLFKLDGEDHPFEVPHVLPLGIPNIPCMYRAELQHPNGPNEPPRIFVLIHGFFPRLHGVRFEIVRYFSIYDDKQVLETEQKFIVIRSNGARQVHGVLKQRFFKMCSEEDLGNLWDFGNDFMDDQPILDLFS